MERDGLVAGKGWNPERFDDACHAAVRLLILDARRIDPHVGDAAVGTYAETNARFDLGVLLSAGRELRSEPAEGRLDQLLVERCRVLLRFEDVDELLGVARNRA